MNDATKYLIYAREKGFKDAYIVTQSEINNASSPLVSLQSGTGPIPGNKVYTIQISASKEKQNMNQFKAIDGVKELVSEDGYYRYVCGEYNSFTQAKTALITVQESGFKKAFVRELNSPDNK
jgi:septal ring-binding cell division protein DamX